MIEMMNDLFSGKRPTDMFGDDKTMFGNIPMIVSHISKFGWAFDILASSSTSPFAKRNTTIPTCVFLANDKTNSMGYALRRLFDAFTVSIASHFFPFPNSYTLPRAKGFFMPPGKPSRRSIQGFFTNSTFGIGSFLLGIMTGKFGCFSKALAFTIIITIKMGLSPTVRFALEKLPPNLCRE